MAVTPSNPAAERPWWRFGMVWLVISGPAVVVVAGLVTGWIAVRYADPVIMETPVPATEQDASNAPALKVRNHAATPRQP
jgi:hypothetical protein